MKLTTEEQQKTKELQQILVTKAWKSATFKEQLINNPVRTIEDITGQKMSISADTKFIVEDQTDVNTIYLNIPRYIDVDNLELSEEELSSVTGGGTTTPLCIIGGAALALYTLGVTIYGVSHHHCDNE